MEFGLVLFLLTIPVLNVVDLAFYAFTWMQTQNAAQMGAQAAFSNCNTANSLPAATSCAQGYSANNLTLYDVVYQGVQESALNNTVTLTNGNVVDGYYCSSSSNVLSQVGSLGVAYADADTIGDSVNGSNFSPTEAANTTCSGFGYADTQATPGEYVTVNVTHTYQSIFPGMTVVALLPPTMTATAYARVS
jgi:hypothetical protein